MKPEEITSAIATAPAQVHDPEDPYDPNDPAAVEAFWKNATVRRPGQRGPGRSPPQIATPCRIFRRLAVKFQRLAEKSDGLPKILTPRRKTQRLAEFSDGSP
jgi:hypothetical protein